MAWALLFCQFAAFSAGIGGRPHSPALSAAAAMGRAVGRIDVHALASASTSANRWQHVPNALTLARMAAIPALGCSFYSASAVGLRLPAYIFAAIAATDFADGYIARRFSAHSEFGAFLDPVADKICVCVCLLLLCDTYGALVVVPAALITAREIAVSALREWMATSQLRESVGVGLSGKLKTATQMLSLQALLLALPGSPPIGMVTRALSFCAGIALLYSAACLSLISGVELMLKALTALRAKAGKVSEE